MLAHFMSPPTQTLRILQPTPSTVSFTVSTRAIPKTLPAVLASCLSILTRICLGIFVLLLLWARWRITSSNSPGALAWAIGNAGEAWLVPLLRYIQWRYLAPCALVALWLVFKRGYTEESLTLLHGLGLQTSTSSAMYLTPPTTRFIPTTSIQDIFIHEAFKGFGVSFYLSIVVKGEQDVVVVFPKMLPRRAILEKVWRGARACLYEGVKTTIEIKKGEVEYS
ncbi:hypothetical protein BS50DRAFT_544675 [Corynespora cassiicola Philippines]|uniref:Phosphatidylinositol N-acetylglucosaminyltransferase subunit H conserved domain-containing protein n=1 Tax=Corynespora cassiicola Philippines TaxID=1448308 RepID=A0A2T2P3J3_CORCC|nr:hypothetical protein BS50DRAFT_544675 [Corynespora cassiicola Philippines]